MKKIKTGKPWMSKDGKILYGFLCPECGRCRTYTNTDDPQIICSECEKLFLNPVDEGFIIEMKRKKTEKNVEIAEVENNKITLRAKDEVTDAYLENVLGLPRYRKKEGLINVGTNLFEVKKPRTWHLPFGLGVLVAAAIYYILPDTITILY